MSKRKLLPYEEIFLVVVAALIVGNVFANYYGFGIILFYMWVKRVNRGN